MSSAVTLDAKRAKVNCAASLNVKTDGPLTVTITDCAGGASVTHSYS